MDEQHAQSWKRLAAAEHTVAEQQALGGDGPTHHEQAHDPDPRPRRVVRRVVLRIYTAVDYRLRGTTRIASLTLRGPPGSDG